MDFDWRRRHVLPLREIDDAGTASRGRAKRFAERAAIAYASLIGLQDLPYDLTFAIEVLAPMPVWRATAIPPQLS